MNKTVQTMFLACCFTVSAQTVSLRWPADLGDARPARFTLVRGDTVQLVADLFVDGRPYNPAGDASLLWQTNGMNELWWQVPASVASNCVSATWTPAMDCGASSYLAHFRVGSSTGSVFRAYVRLAMQHGPGDPVNALPLPVPVLDFDKVIVTNAPWSGGGGTDGRAVTNIVEGIVADATNGVVKVENGQVLLDDAEISAAGATLGILAVGDLRAGGAAAFYGGDGDEYELAVKGDIPDLNNYDGDIHTGGSIDGGSVSVQGVAVATQADIARTPVSSVSTVRYASGVLSLTVPASATLSASLDDWPDGAAVFSRMSAGGPYSVANSLKLLGYGFWPTNSAAVVFVRDGSRILANVLEGN